VVGLPAWEQVRSLHRRQLRDQDSKNPKEVLRFYFGNRDKTPAGGPRPLNEAKVLVLGEAEVGKTSLIAALTERRLRQSFDKTHGIVRQRWVVPGPGASPADVPAPRRAPSGGLFWGRLTKWLRGQSLLQLDAPHFRLNVWDFGGQEIYHATHMFFLTQRAVYVVVADARQNDRQNNLDYWLQMARSFGGGAPIWVAVNKCDQPGDGPDEQALLRKFAPELRGFVRTSCWSGEGLEELARKLVDEIAAMEEVRRLMNPAWLQIKQELEQMPGDTLSLEEYGDLCQRCGEADPADQQMLLGLWHRLGTVLYFHEEDDPPEMKELGILNPEWVTRGVYAVLDSPELRERGGLLTEDLLAEVLHRAGYKGGQPRFIEQMMRKFDLLYDAPDQRPRAVLVPQLLADKEPALNWPVSGTLRFCYEYEVLPAGLLPRFIVRLHRHLASKPGPWRKGCVLNLSGCQVLVRGDLERKQVEVSVREGPPAMRREALDRVRFTFDSIHAEIKDLPVKELIPVPGRPDAPCIDYRHLRTWEWNGRAVFDAMGSQPGEIIPVNVREALEGVRSPLRAELERAEHFKKQRLRERVAIYTDKIQMESLMKEDRRVQVGGSVGGGARLGTGEQTSQGDRLKITARDAGELLQLVAELRQLIAQARAAGAEADNCDVAEEATVKIQTALQSPSQPAARKEAKGALAMLKGTAEGFGTLADIGEKFARILKFVEPGIEKLFEVMT
jgi:internalin A